MPKQTTTPQPNELSLEDQLDSLLTHLDQIEPGLVSRAKPASDAGAPKSGAAATTAAATVDSPAPPVATAQVSPPPGPQDLDSLSQQIDAMLNAQQGEQAAEVTRVQGPAAAAKEPAPPQTGSPLAKPPASGAGGDDLAMQLDQLLAQSMQAEGPVSAPAPTLAPVTANTQPPTTPAAVPANKVSQASSGANPTVEKPRSSTDQPSTRLSNDDLSLQIDQLLAEQNGPSKPVEPVNVKVASDPASKESVADAGAKGASTPAPVAAAPEGPGEQVSLADIDALLAEQAESQLSAGLGTPLAATPETGSGKQPAQGPSHAEATGADAASVAKELDEQPELQAQSSDAAVTKVAVQAARVAPKPKPKKLRGDFLRGVFTVINRPLAGCSPAVRDTLGYVALLHFFVGSVLIVAKLIGWV
jgi:hypothetical protein